MMVIIMRNDVLQVILETFEDAKDINIQKVWVLNDNEVYGLFTHHVNNRLSFLSKPEFSIETEVDGIKIVMFEIGAVLYHIYYKGWLKFVPFFIQYDSLIESADDFLKLTDYITNNVPLHIAKHNIITHINQILDNFDEKSIPFIFDEILAYSFYDKTFYQPDFDFSAIDIFDNEWQDIDKIKTINYLQDVKQILEHDCKPAKISEKTMNEIDATYIRLQIDSDNI